MIRITKAAYTSIGSQRVVSPGLYEDKDFSKEELSFLENLGAVKVLKEKQKEEVKPEVEEVTQSLEVTPETEEKPSRKRLKSKE